MSSGITFNDYREAREYQEMLLKEGLNSHLASSHGKYVVIPKEKTKIKIETREELPEHTSAIHYGWESGEHEIYLEPKASTKVKLHEVGHVKLGHITRGGRTLGESLERELDAEAYAWEQMGKELDYMVGVNALRKWVWGKRIDYLQIPSAINEVARRLEQRGINVTRDNKRRMFDMLFAKTDDPEIEAAKEDLKEEL